MKQAIFGLSLLAALAATFPSQATEQTKISTVAQVYPQANGSFAVSLVDAPTACTSTFTPKRLYVKVGENSVTAEALRAMYAAALVALTAQLTVYVAYDDATSSCYVNRVLVYSS